MVNVHRWPDEHRGRSRLSRRVGLSLLLTVGPAAVIGAAFLAWRTDGHRPGELAGWLEAIATLAAFAAAVYAAWYAAGAFTLERDRDERFLAAQRTAQASLVAGWYGVREEHWSAPQNARFLMPTEGSRHFAGVYLRNASDVPVTNIVFEVGAVVTDPETCTERQERFGVQELDLLPPALEPLHVPLDQAVEENMNEVIETVDAEGDCLRVVVSVSFRDGANQVWHRSHTGELALLDAPRARRSEAAG